MDTSNTGSEWRRWTRQQHQRLLTKFHQSQLTQSEFATQHGVGLSTLSTWLRVEREVVPPEVNSKKCGCQRHGIKPFDYLKDLFKRLFARRQN